MKYCIKCLSENPDDAKRCEKCKFEFNQTLDIIGTNKDKKTSEIIKKRSPFHK